MKKKRFIVLINNKSYQLQKSNSFQNTDSINHDKQNQEMSLSPYHKS